MPPLAAGKLWRGGRSMLRPYKEKNEHPYAFRSAGLLPAFFIFQGPLFYPPAFAVLNSLLKGRAGDAPAYSGQEMPG